jgi:hypothetical protein
MVQGEWTIILPDGTGAGVARCNNAFLSRLAKALSYLGAEPGDLVLLTFDRASRSVALQVGGVELVELAQSGELHHAADEPDVADGEHAS